VQHCGINGTSPWGRYLPSSVTVAKSNCRACVSRENINLGKDLEVEGTCTSWLHATSKREGSRYRHQQRPRPEMLLSPAATNSVCVHQTEYPMRGSSGRRLLSQSAILHSHAYGAARRLCALDSVVTLVPVPRNHCCLFKLRPPDRSRQLLKGHSDSRARRSNFSVRQSRSTWPLAAISPPLKPNGVPISPCNRRVLGVSRSRRSEEQAASRVAKCVDCHAQYNVRGRNGGIQAEEWSEKPKSPSRLQSGFTTRANATSVTAMVKE